MMERVAVFAGRRSSGSASVPTLASCHLLVRRTQSGTSFIAIGSAVRSIATLSGGSALACGPPTSTQFGRP